MKLLACFSLVVASMALVAPSTKASSLEFLSTDINEIAAMVEAPQTFDPSTPGECGPDLPDEFAKDFPYYFLGYDFQDRPVILAEIGAWRLQKWTEFNETSRQMLRTFAEQFWCRLRNLALPSECSDSTATGVFLIFDCGNFAASELLNLEVIKAWLYFSNLGAKHDAYVTEEWMIKVDFALSAWLGWVRPVAGRLVGRLENKGFQEDEYLPALRSQMDESIIPPWLGGTAGKNWKPLQFWG